MSGKTQRIICAICKKLITFQVPKDKRTLTMNIFVSNACIWSENGMLNYIRYINGVHRQIC